MPDLWIDVDAAVTVPVNLLPLIDDTDFKSIEIDVAYNAAGMALTWHFVTCAGAITATAVTPTTGGAYDWAEDVADKGTYKIEIPASGGASINNDTEGFGWFTGVATGVLPWRGPVIGFRAAGLNDKLIESAYSATRALAGTALPDAAAAANGGLPTTDGTKVSQTVDLTAGQSITASTVSDKTGYALSSAGVQAIWDALVSALATVGSIGKRIVDYLDVAISSRSTYAGGAVASVTGAVGSVAAGVTVTTNNDKTGYALTVAPPTAAEVRQEIDANSTKLANAVPTAAAVAAAVGAGSPATEAYAAAGAIPTRDQAILAILQLLSERSIVSTTMTVKKLNGSTTAMTFTLNDATTPTAITRAT